jgi:exopolysaccharide biosynthesis predicted pyruvyltransferase EpsI
MAVIEGCRPLTMSSSLQNVLFPEAHDESSSLNARMNANRTRGPNNWLVLPMTPQIHTDRHAEGVMILLTITAKKSLTTNAPYHKATQDYRSVTKGIVIIHAVTRDYKLDKHTAANSADNAARLLGESIFLLLW